MVDRVNIGVKTTEEIDPEWKIAAIKDLISEISHKPLEEHCDAFDLVHTQLHSALSEIDGL